jgi:hypothetical protein
MKKTVAAPGQLREKVSKFPAAHDPVGTDWSSSCGRVLRRLGMGRRAHRLRRSRAAAIAVG